MMTAMNPPRTFDDSFYLYGDAAKKKISLDDTEKAKSEPLFRKKSSGINNNVNVNIDFSRFGQYALFYITPHFDSNYSSFIYLFFIKYLFHVFRLSHYCFYP